MALFEIKHRWTGAVLFSVDIGSFKLAVEAAVRSEANLRWANLSEADLSEANLRWANLSEANLSGANLSEANLSEANLSGANLSEANLSGANLSGASLSKASLSEADLRWANLSEADLSGASLSKASLSEADLSGASLSKANLSGASLSKASLQVPIVEHLDATILAAIEAGGTLAMGAWHQCQTTHCRAGWAIHLAGEAGYALEERVGACAAGALIYQASAGYVPDFYATNADAAADMRAHATPEEAAHGR